MPEPTMKAAVRRHYGGPDTIRIEDLPVPIPAPNEVLVRVHATTVNRTDCGILTGKPLIFRLFIGLRSPRKPILGSDFAGVVTRTGSKVTAFKEGDRVWGLHDEGLQSQAEYLVMDQHAGILHIPDGIGFETAAASAEGAHYAYNFITKVPLKPGDRVLVNGGTGAIGSAAIQLLAAAGANVTAVCATPHMEAVRQLGADHVIDYLNEDFTTIPQTFPFVFDAVGKSSFGACKARLEPRGVYISSELGPRNENPFLALVTPLLGGKKVGFPVPLDVRRSLTHIHKLLAEGRFRPMTDRSYMLDEVADAYRYVLSGQKIGNVLLRL